jgi:hypothetical protein
MMVEYYQNNLFKDSDFSLEKFAIDRAFYHWDRMDMNVHLLNKEAQEMGGYPGFAGMLIQYATQFKKENEKIQIIATEVSFGSALEVPLYIFNGESIDDPLYCHADVYLAGRYDIVADDGIYIFPMDHKTMGSFRGDPLNRFVIDEGPTGYVYGLNHILPSIVPPEQLLKRSCNRISMNLISKAIPKEGSRFRRLPIYKSEEQLKQYRQRQITTCNNLLNDLSAYVHNLGVPRDTSKCCNWFFRNCNYFDVCRQADKSAEEATLNNGFQKLPIWNTEKVSIENGE